MALRVRLGLSCLLVASLPLLATGCGDDDDTPAVDSGPGGDGGGDGGADGGTGFAVLNPFLPADDQLMVLPYTSVIVTITLLKVALTNTLPLTSTWIFFFFRTTSALEPPFGMYFATRTSVPEMF